MARVFISYRRSDSKWAVGRLYDRLSKTIGKDNLFLDVTNIDPGEEFAACIRETVGRCDVLLAVIGPSWAATRDSAGKRRLDSPDDFVRLEISAALQRGIRVIPMLLDGAVMPNKNDLPDDIAALAGKHAHDISFVHFDATLEGFMHVLQRILSDGAGAPLQPLPSNHRLKGDVKLPEPVPSVLPFTISLATPGRAAAPLIGKGTRLPAEATRVLSTNADNDSFVECTLALGDQKQIRDNTFVERNIFAVPPAPRGVPKIRIKVSVDAALILTVTTLGAQAHREKAGSPIDLTRIIARAAAWKGPPQDFRMNPAVKDETELRLSAADATRGVEREITLPDGQRVSIQIPPGAEDGGTLRLRNRGVERDGMRGDFHVRLVVSGNETELTLSAADAARGVDRKITLPDGQQVSIRIPPGAKDGGTLRLRGRGSATKPSGGPSDFYVRLVVTPPRPR